MYVTPRERQRLDREEQQARIAAICRGMKPVRDTNRLGATRTVWNECLQRYVEVR